MMSALFLKAAILCMAWIAPSLAQDSGACLLDCTSEIAHLVNTTQQSQCQLLEPYKNCVTQCPSGDDLWTQASSQEGSSLGDIDVACEGGSGSSASPVTDVSSSAGSCVQECESKLAAEGSSADELCAGWNDYIACAEACPDGNDQVAVTKSSLPTAFLIIAQYCQTGGTGETSAPSFESSIAQSTETPSGESETPSGSSEPSLGGGGSSSDVTETPIGGSEPSLGGGGGSTDVTETPIGGSEPSLGGGGGSSDVTETPIGGSEPSLGGGGGSSDVTETPIGGSEPSLGGGGGSTDVTETPIGGSEPSLGGGGGSTDVTETPMGSSGQAMGFTEAPIAGSSSDCLDDCYKALISSTGFTVAKICESYDNYGPCIQACPNGAKVWDSVTSAKSDDISQLDSLCSAKSDNPIALRQSAPANPCTSACEDKFKAENTPAMICTSQRNYVSCLQDCPKQSDVEDALKKFLTELVEIINATCREEGSSVMTEPPGPSTPEEPIGPYRL